MELDIIKLVAPYDKLAWHAKRVQSLCDDLDRYGVNYFNGDFEFEVREHKSAIKKIANDLE